MEDNFSLISSSYKDPFYPHEHPTLFEKVEKMMNTLYPDEFNTHLDNLDDQNEVKNLGKNNTIDGEGRNIITNFNSSTLPSSLRNKPFFEFQNDFIDNDTRNKILPLLENQTIFNTSENSKEDIKEEKLSSSFEMTIKNIKNSSVNLLLGKKRKLKEKNIARTKEDIFEEIKILFDEYNKKYNLINEIVPSYKIYEAIVDVSKKNATIVEEKIPGCVIYFYANKITHIYLIREKKFLKEEKDILEILETIKKNISKNS